MKATERQVSILDRIREDGRVDVEALSHGLGVSAVTIRNDLKFLESKHLLRRVRGGAVATRASRFERPVDINASLNIAEKTAIAIAACQLVRDGETIMLGSGSTIEAMAEQLPVDLSDVAVVTNSLNVAFILANHPAVTVIVTGGTLRPMGNSLVEPYGCKLLDEINADFAFVGCSGIAADKGFTTTSWHEAAVSKALMRSARRTVFLADHSKLGQVTTARIAGLDEADHLVTDKSAGAAAVKSLRAAGLEVVLA